MEIGLRELCREDLEQINRWRNDHEVLDYLGANFLYIGEEIDQVWFNTFLKHRDRDVRLAILDTTKSLHIGNVNLTGIHPINRTAEFSIMIGEKDYWSKGAGTKATQLILRHGFEDLNLNRIYLYVLTGNERARKMYYSLGFTSEGCLRQATYKNGDYKDLEIMALLKKDYHTLNGL